MKAEKKPFSKQLSWGEGMDVGAPDEPTILEITIGDSADSDSELGVGAFAQGEQTNADGQFTVLTSDVEVP